MRRLLSMLAFLCMLIAISGCSNGGETLTISNGIPVLNGLEPDDIDQIFIDSLNEDITFMDKADISLCLAGMKSIRLGEKSQDAITEWPRSFEFTLKKGDNFTISFCPGILRYGGGDYYYTESNNPVTSGRVHLISRGKTYDPAVNWVYSQEYSGLCGDGGWFGAELLEWNKELKTELDEMETIPFSDDIAIQCVWDYEPDMLYDTTYSVFDSNLNKLSEETAGLSIPEESGIYYIAVPGHWGTDYRYEGYQYIFKIKRDSTIRRG
jgi:hypothetical protein